MKIYNLCPGAYVLEDFLSDTHFKYLENLALTSKYTHIDSDQDSWKFQLSFIEGREILSSIIGQDIERIETIILKITSEKFCLSHKPRWFTKMEQWSFMSPHQDSSFPITAIVYLNNCDLSDGGQIVIDKVSYSPKKNSLVLFKGDLIHEVKPIIIDKCRYSFVMGFCRC